MAKKQPGDEPDQQGAKKTKRIYLRADQDFRERLERQANRLKVDMSQYIRMVVLRQLEQDEETDPTL